MKPSARALETCNVSSPVLSIIIPVHNQSDYTRACLISLKQHPPTVPYEIIVVDDGSTDTTCHVVTSFNPDLPVRLTHNPPPHRFARACNHGAREARGNLLLLLNNDTELLAGWFAPLYQLISSQPDVGIVVPKLIFPDGTIQHCGKVWIDSTAPDAQPHHLYYRFPAGHAAVQKSRDFQTVTGACMLVRRYEFLALGGFDERYENGWEDDDLCYAYRSKGMRIHYCALSTVIHHQNKTLNERLTELEQKLPSKARLHQLDQAFADNSVSAEDLMLAEKTRQLYAAVEQELVQIRDKFQRNRAHFFSKWGKSLTSDLLDYIRSDNVAPEDALGEQLSPEMRNELRRLYGDAPMPLISIIILTYNRLDVTRACLDSIHRNTPQSHEIIIVDNGSTDGTVTWLQQRCIEQPTIRLIANTENRGFAAGSNQGMQAATGSYVMLLNNDTVVTPDWLTGLLECIADPSIGIVGPVTNNLSGVQQWPWCAYATLEELDSFAARFREQHRYWWIPSRRIVGFCMLFRRSLIERIGLLDEQFGSGNFEDDDFCLRAALEGYRNLVAGDVFIHHVGSATFAGNDIDYQAAMQRNYALFQQKWSKPVVAQDEAARILVLKTLEAADQLCRRGKVNSAVELILKEGIAQLPDEPRFYHALAELFLDAAMPQEALDVLKEAPDQQERSALLQAVAIAALGNTPEALRLLAQAADVRTADYEWVHGTILVAARDTVAANECFLNALSMNPACEAAYSGLAELAELAGDREAVFRLREQAAVCGGWKQTVLERCHAAIQTDEQLVHAEQTFRELRHYYPDVSVLTSLHVDLLLRLKRNAEAMDAIEGLLLKGQPSQGLYDAALQVRSSLGPMQIPQELKSKGTSVSLCMIAKDEERHLARCLASVKPLVDEMIVVDTGSTDRTRKLATIFGARVVSFEWRGDYAAARNAGLEQASGDWIFTLDADEVISPADYPLFGNLLKAVAGAKRAFTVTTRNYTNRLDIENWQPNRGEYPNEEAGRGWMPSDKVRLFPNMPGIRFDNAIHEMVEPSLDRAGISCVDVAWVVHHYGYLDDQRQQRKKEYYYELGKRKFEESGGSPQALVELAIQAAGIGRYEEAIALWHKALAIDPQSYLAWFNLGHACLQQGQFAEGCSASRKAMALRGNYREAVINAAICELAQGNLDQASALVAESLAQNPDYPTLPLMSAVIKAAQGDSGAALEQFKALVDQHIDFQTFIHEVSTKLVQGGQQILAQRLIDTAATGGYCLADTQTLVAAH